jgi:curved DNA-binding protein CbpA
VSSVTASRLIRPPPSATGTLGATPLVHLLLYAVAKKLAGTIELSTPGPDGATGSILLIGGEPAKVKTSEPGNYLGGILVEMGYVDAGQLTTSLATLAKAKNQPGAAAFHGQILLEQGAIDERKLEAGLREQVTRKLRQIAAMAPETSYVYLAGFDGLLGFGPDASRGFDPLPLLWPLICEKPPWEQVTAALGRLQRSALRLAPGADLEKLGLPAPQTAAIELLRIRPMSMDELASASRLPAEHARLLVYLLLATRQVELVRSGAQPARPASRVAFGSAVPGVPSSPPASGTMSRPVIPPVIPSSAPAPASAPAGATAAANPPTAATVPAPPAGSATPAPPQAQSVPDDRIPPPPRGLSPRLIERWNEIFRRAEALDGADHFQVLGVGPDATREQIDEAYFSVAKRFHPDTLPKEISGARAACSSVFSRMAEAHGVLSNSEKRGRYQESLVSGAAAEAEQELVEKALTALTDFQMAEVHLKRGENEQAEELARKAVEGDASQADYHALLAWVLALRPDHQGPEPTRASIRMLDHAIQVSDRCEKAYFWRGMLHQRLGDGALAFRDFKRAADLNPQNVDAVREVRLYRMRGDTKPPSTARPGSSAAPKRAPSAPLMDRLFKK